MRPSKVCTSKDLLFAPARSLFCTCAESAPYMWRWSAESVTSICFVSVAAPFRTCPLRVTPSRSSPAHTTPAPPLLSGVTPSPASVGPLCCLLGVRLLPAPRDCPPQRSRTLQRLLPSTVLGCTLLIPQRTPVRAAAGPVTRAGATTAGPGLPAGLGLRVGRPARPQQDRQARPRPGAREQVR